MTPLIMTLKNFLSNVTKHGTLAISQFQVLFLERYNGFDLEINIDINFNYLNVYMMIITIIMLPGRALSIYQKP